MAWILFLARRTSGMALLGWCELTTSPPRGRRPPEALGVASGTPVGQGGVVSGGGWPLGWRCETRAISTQIAHRRKGISSRTVGTRSSSVLEQTEGGEAESEQAKNQRLRSSRQLTSGTHPKVLEPKVFQRDKGIFGTKVFFNTFATPPPIGSEETQHK